MNTIPPIIGSNGARTLTQSDIDAIQAIIVSNRHGGCSFNAEEVQQVKDLLSMYKETRSIVLKAILGVVGIMVFWLLIIAYQHGMLKK